MRKGRVTRYNSEQESQARKKRKVTHVRWFEPLNEGENNNKFLAVFEDGMIYVYFRDSRHSNETRGFKIKTQDNNTNNEYTRD